MDSVYINGHWVSSKYIHLLCEILIFVWSSCGLCCMGNKLILNLSLKSLSQTIIYLEIVLQKHKNI